MTPPDAVGDLHGYDAVVLGSAVYAGHWLHPALQFADRLAAELTAHPSWLFSTSWPSPGPVEHRLFAGPCTAHG